MALKLSEGSLVVMLNGGDVNPPPVLQILGHKKIATSGANERYRLLISDGVSLNSFAMLATQLNDKITSGQLSDNTIVRVNRHIISNVNSTLKGPNRKVLIILDMTVLALGEDVGCKIGDPIAMTDPPSYDSSSSVNNEERSVESPINKTSHSDGGRRTFGNGIMSIDGKSPTANSVALKKTHPIATLNPFQSRWTIKARVTNKSAIRTWSNARGDGKLFSIDLTDETASIRATAFNDHCDKFYDLLEMEKIYYITRCQLKPANKKFTSLKHDFEITFTNDTEVVPCYELDDSIPHLQFDLVKLDSLKDVEAESFVDVIGVCHQCGNLQNLVAKQSRRELKKRDVTLVDQTLSSITLTLWGSQAEDFDGSLQPIVAIKGGRVADFGGSRSISLVSSSVMQINPDIPEAHRLRGWYDSLSSDVQFENVAGRTGADGGIGGSGAKLWTLVEARENGIGSNPDKADYFNAEATVYFIQMDRAVYQACPNGNCQKKVVDQNNGMYRCEKCCQEFPNFKYRLMLTMQISDWTETQWVTVFQDATEVLLEATADEIGNSRDTAGSYESYFHKALFKKYIFRIRAKMDTFNNETRLRMSVVSVKPFDPTEACKRLLEDLKRLSGVGIAATV